MRENKFIYSLKVTGLQRKELAGVIAACFGTAVRYKGAPGFEYLISDNCAREWQVDKEGRVSTPELGSYALEEGLSVFQKLALAGAVAEGRASVCVTLKGHNGVTLRNLINIIASKQMLLKKALNLDTELVTDSFIEAINNQRLVKTEDFKAVLDEIGEEGCPGFTFDLKEEKITCRWFNGSLKPDEIQAYIQLVQAVNKQALTQKHSTPKLTKNENEKYAFRVWLLRIGFVGDAYKTSRKLLLERLSGNSAFRTEEAAQKAVMLRANRKKEAEGVEVAAAV